MPFGKDGKHYMNPQIAKMHDNTQGEAAGPHHAEGSMQPRPHASMIEVHHPDGHDNPSKGQHHTVIHHMDGSREHNDHPDLQAVHDHIDMHMGEESSEPADNPDEETAEMDQPTMGQVHRADSGAY